MWLLTGEDGAGGGLGGVVLKVTPEGGAAGGLRTEGGAGGGVGLAGARLLVGATVPVISTPAHLGFVLQPQVVHSG